MSGLPGKCGVIMKFTWRSTLLVAVSAVCCAVAASAQQSQERTAPRAVARLQASDEIKVDKCFLNVIDKRTLAASRAGILAFVKPEEGHTLKVSEVIAKVRDEIAAAQFATADKTAKNDIEIRFAKASADLAQIELLKATQANATLPGTITNIEIQRLRLASDRAALQIENAQKEFDIAGSKRDEAGELLNTHVVETTMGGLVTKVYKHTGEAVREGDPIIDIVNTDRMRVRGYVAYANASKVHLGDKVSMKLDVSEADLAEKDMVFEGKVTYIAPSVSRSSSPEVEIYAEVANRDGVLRDGARVFMSLTPRKGGQAPVNATTKRDVPRRPGATQE